jgi:DNA-binding CsgD family transcriptional regulator/tetratricopeptide (TPR) repeat protein
MAVIEFHEALDVLWGELARASAGRGGTTAVVGGLASGKTALLQEFSQRASVEGAWILRASGAMAERSLPLGVVEQLVQSGELGESADRLTRLIGACEAGRGRSPDHESGDSCRCARMCRDLAKMLLRSGRGRSGADRPAVICVDDAEFTDYWSMRVLVSLDRRLRNAHGMLVLTARSPASFATPLLTSEMSRPNRRRIELAPMSAESVEGLFAKAFDKDIAERIAPPCHRLTAGNPLLVSAILADYQNRQPADLDAAGPPAEQAVDGRQLPAVGVHYQQAIVEIVHRWELQLLGAARALAVLDEQCPPSLLGRLLGLGTITAAGLLRILSVAGLVTDGRFRHPAATEAVLADMTVQERAELHRRVAESLFGRGTPAVDVARHLLAADGTHEAWAARVLREAAEQILAAEDPAYAVRCLELALAWADNTADRLGVACVLARALEQVNPVATAAHLDPLWAAMARGELRDRDLLTVARLALWQGAQDRVQQVLHPGTGTRRLLETKTEAELRIAYQWFHGCRRDWPERGADESHDPWLDLARSLATLWRGGTSGAVAGARQVLQSYRLGEIAVEVVATALLALAHADQSGQAVLCCDRLIGQAERRGAVTWEALLRVVRAEIALLQGEPALAVALVELALRRLSAPRWGVLIAYPLATLVTAHTALGSYEVAAQVLAQRIPDAADDTVWGLRYRHARGRLKLATGAVLAAANDFHHCGRLMRRWGVDGPVLALWRVDLAEAHFRLGRSDVARELLKAQLARHGGDARVRGRALQVHAAGVEPEQRPALLHESVDCLRAAGDRLGLIAALTELSRVHEQLGNHEEARAVAGRVDQEWRLAAGSAPDRGALPTPPPLVPADRAGLTVSPGPATEDDPVGASGVPLLSVLTDSERRVAELARFGYPNREIACRLFITVSTVEQHLTRIYRKLKVKRKAELRALLTSVGAGAAAPTRGAGTAAPTRGAGTGGPHTNDK